MKRKLLNYTMLSMLALTIASCGQVADSNSTSTTPSGDISATSNESVSSSEEEYSESLGPAVDELDVIPEEVKNYQGNIDLLVYIEGTGSTPQTDPDIGSGRYKAENINYIEKARFYAAARAFKKVAPGVKINLLYCNIADYDDALVNYNSANNHYPHLMWSTKHCVEMIQQGIYKDLSEYADTDYFDSFNDYFMSRFNYGGFQSAIPISAEPWGVFVNVDSLKNNSIVDTTDLTTGSKYAEWVDNFTWEQLLKTAKDTNTDTHAGISYIIDHLASYSAPTVYDQFLTDGTVSLNNETIKKLLQYEQELTQYSAWDYSEGCPSDHAQLSAKEGFEEAHNWSGVKNFAEDQLYTFYSEAPWALPTVSQYITEHENVDTRVDFLPYPKVDNDAQAYSGIAVEGMGVGNLCPIVNGKEKCYSSTAKVEEEVAAYFAMFMSADIRSIEERASIEYVYNDIDYKGSISLPLIKKGFTFQWQEDPDCEYKNPLDGSDYADNWEYQMGKWFDVYGAYVTNNEPADVKNFSNITYGLTKVLDTVYGDNITTLNYYNEPFEIEYETETKNIWKKWQNRYAQYGLGLASYVSDTSAALVDMEEEINTNTELAWDLIQEMLDMFYGEGKYDVSPEGRANRNDYRN